MAKRPSRPKPDDPAAISRKLRSDSQALRDAEWWVRRRIYGLSDQEARRLFDLYMQTYRQMAGTLSMAYGSDGSPDLARRAQLLRQLEAEMATLAQQTGISLDDALVAAYQQGYAGRAWALDMATNPDVPVRLRPVLPANAIRAALLQPYLGTPWHEELGYNFAEYTTRIRRSVTASLMQGEGMAQAQRRLRDELGVVTDRRKGFRRNFYRTLLITRTEIMRASNLGALAVYEENQDILNGWEWVATKDERTCPICGGMDGKRFGFGDAQMQPPSGSHPGCRCTIVPVLKDERLMNEVAGVRETYSDWAARRGMVTDGGLGGQRGAAPPSTKAVSAAPTAKVWDEDRPRELLPIPESLHNKGRQWLESMNEEERAAIEAWSGSGYRAINATIQGERLLGWNDDDVIFWKRVADKFETALQRAPTTEQVTWRGIYRRDLPSFESAFEHYQRQIGTTIQWTGYSSASLDPIVAARFSVEAKQGVVFEVRSIHGRYIDPASRYGLGAEQPETAEYEVIFSPGTRLRIIEVREVTLYDVESDRHISRTLVIAEDVTHG